MNGFNRWIRSKQGLAGMGLALVVVLVLALVATQSGLFGAAGGGSKGPEPTQPPTYPDPQGGYTCLPTCSETDGKFFGIANEGERTFAGAKTVVWIGVSGNLPSFELGIFDADSGKDGTGAINQRGGHWDETTQESVYTLYADPLKDGTGQTVLGSWNGNTVDTQDNAWWTQAIPNNPAALSPSGHYFYRLEVTQNVVQTGYNGFKLRSSGYLSTGRNELVGSSLGFLGALSTKGDKSVIYPQFVDANNLGPTTYSGNWAFYFYVTNTTSALEIWDGDFDRGYSETVSSDTDDPNTQGKPAWAGPYAMDERAGGKGAPADDSANAYFRRSPAVQYTIIDPVGNPIYTNSEPSGTEEWERFVLSTDPNVQPDMQVQSLNPGLYGLSIEGLDAHNLVFLRLNQEICDPEDGCGPPVYPETSCPRTIGYWKNNVKKVLIEGKTNGVQETADSIHKALGHIAERSPLYRTGLNVAAPVANANQVPLTDQEAHDILQKTAGNSMLDRALQQNLAAQLNLASGKIGENAWVVITAPSGTFEGRMVDALKTAEDIILSGDQARLEYAKDIADMINNGQINTDPEQSFNPDGSPVCSNPAVPPTLQPPEDPPAAPTPTPEGPTATPPAATATPEPPTATPEPPTPTPNVPVCIAGERHYRIENTSNNPFYSIKFNFAGGMEVKDGGSDVFKYILSRDALTVLSQMQVEVKAADDPATYTLVCDFTSAAACGDPVGDPAKYTVQFLGATDLGDGNLELKFQVWNYTGHGLSHVAFELPAGAIPVVTYVSQTFAP